MTGAHNGVDPEADPEALLARDDNSNASTPSPRGPPTTPLPYTAAELRLIARRKEKLDSLMKKELEKKKHWGKWIVSEAAEINRFSTLREALDANPGFFNRGKVQGVELRDVDLGRGVNFWAGATHKVRHGFRAG